MAIELSICVNCRTVAMEPRQTLPGHKSGCTCCQRRRQSIVDVEKPPYGIEEMFEIAYCETCKAFRRFETKWVQSV